MEGYAVELTEYLGYRVELPKERWLSCSIGVTDSRYLHDIFDDAELLQNADQMLYEVKRNGKGHVRQTTSHRICKTDNAAVG